MKKVLLLFCQGTEIFEAAAFYDVLGWSGAHGSECVQVVTAGLRPEVTCTFGMIVKPETLLAEVAIEEFDAIAIPGGFEDWGFYEEAYSGPVVELIRRFNEQNKPIASICVGALPVANAGLLIDKPATTYGLLGGRRREQLAALGARVVDIDMVLTGNITTSTGPGRAIEVALALLATLTGKENADQIRHLMGFAPSAHEA